MAMSSAVVTGLFGLGGVVLGGLMAMGSAWWQTANTRKSRLAELQLQLQHERYFRDETDKRSVLLEFIYALERFDDAVVSVSVAHHHGVDRSKWPEAGCDFNDMTQVVTAAIQFCDLMRMRGAVIGAANSDLQYLREAWETLTIFHRDLTSYFGHDKEFDVNREEYCDLGGQFACLEFVILDCRLYVQKELSAILTS